MTAHDTANGPFSELSARMSGITTTLAANTRLSTMAQMLLEAIKREARIAPSSHLETDRARVILLERLIEPITSRLNRQDVQIEMLTTMVQNQLTAVRKLLLVPDRSLIYSTAISFNESRRSQPQHRASQGLPNDRIRKQA